MQLKLITSILDPYEKLPLECDGFTRIAHYLLTKKNIPHKCYCGSVFFNDLSMCLHYWIECEQFIIDYKLKMWFGENAPHGVFIKPKNLIYKGNQLQMDCNEHIFKILTIV